MAARINGNIMLIDLSGSEIIEDNRIIFSNRRQDQCNFVIGQNNMNFFGGYENIENYSCEMDQVALQTYKETLVTLPNSIKVFYNNGMRDIEEQCNALIGRQMNNLISPDEGSHRAIIFNRDENEDGTRDNIIYRKIFYEGISLIEIEKNDENHTLIIRPKFNRESEYITKFNRIINTVTLVNNEVINNNTVVDNNDYNKIFYGVPGVGKSHEILRVREDFIQERTVFHPEYTNAEFVGQLMPKYNEIEQRIEYKFEPGPFTRILAQALFDYNSNNKYMLVIEEINRGNAAAIFGEIFQLLDRENGESKYFINNKDICEYIKKIFIDRGEDYFEKFREKFIQYKPEFDPNYDYLVFIPQNLFIWATMNTSDQNVFVLDTAFQRRWGMKMLTIDFDFDINTVNQGNLIIGGTHNLTWKKFVERINREIGNNRSVISTEDKRLGVFFATRNEIENKEKFIQKVIKYLWDDALKLEKFNANIFNISSYPSLEAIVKTSNAVNIYIEDYFVNNFFENNMEAINNNDGNYDEEIDEENN